MESTDIKNLRSKLNLNQTEFSELIGVSLRSVQAYEKGKTKPSADTLMKLLTLHKENMQNSSYLKTTQNFEENKHNNLVEIDSEPNSPSLSTTQGVPYYDVDFIGGFDSVINDGTVHPSFFINFQPFNDADYWVNVTGKSMSPFISHGDIIALKKVESWSDFLLMGEIYAIVTPEFRTVKILAIGENEDSYTLVPYSKDPVFSKQQIPKRLISHVFKVKGSIKKFF